MSNKGRPSEPPHGAQSTMADSDQANQLRLIAADVIHKLWQAGETTQLELLMVQAKRSLEVPFSSESIGVKVDG